MQAARGASLSSDGDQDTTTAPPRRRLGLFSLTVVVAYGLDLVTKVIAVDKLSDQPAVQVIPGVLDLDLIRNGGAAFGMATGLTAVLTLLAVAVVVFVIRLAARLRDRCWALAMGLLLGGALGNLTDRIFRAPAPMRGHVVDFVQLTFVDFPLFNIADSCITLAAALVIVQSVRGVAADGSRTHQSGRSA